MGDDAKPPKSIDGLPKDMQDFLDCKANTLDLTPGKQKWMKNIPEVGGVLEDTDMKFEENKDASVKATASIYGFDQSVNLKVDGAGNLSIDASDSTLINAFKDNIDGWCKDFNNWLRSKGKKLGKPKVSKRGVVTITKEAAGAAMAPQPGGVKEGGLFPNVPLGEKIGAGALFGLSVVGAFAGLPNDTTTVTARTQIVAVAPTPTTEPRPAPTNAPPVTVTPMIGDACVGVDHAAPGQYSFLKFLFTTYPQAAGPWMFQLMQTPTGPLAGIGESDKSGHGEVDVKIFQFGTYNGLVIHGPGNVVVPNGPFGSVLPFTVTSQPKACDANSLNVPTAGTGQTETKPSGNGTLTPEPKTESVTNQVTEHQSGGAPWSLLIIPGSAGVLGGGLALDERRRRRKRRRHHHADDGFAAWQVAENPDAKFGNEGSNILPKDPNVDTGEHPVVQPEKYVDTKVEPPELPPQEVFGDPPPKVDPDSLM